MKDDLVALELAALRAEIAAMRGDLSTFGRGLSVLADAMVTVNERLGLIAEAVTDEPGPSPIHALLETLAHHALEQTAALARIEARLGISEDPPAKTEH